VLNLSRRIDKPDSGQITLSDYDITALSESKLADWARSPISVSFFNFTSDAGFNAFENVELPCCYQSPPH